MADVNLIGGDVVVGITGHLVENHKTAAYRMVGDAPFDLELGSEFLVYVRPPPSDVTGMDTGRQ